MAASTNSQMGGALDPTRDLNMAGAFYAGGALSFAATLPFIGLNVTSTGATGTTATDLGVYYPGVVTVTGASGAGIALNTGAAVPGAFYVIKNMMTGAMNLYAVGGTINGTTGTTAVALTATGNRTLVVFCSVAGAWQAGMNT